MELAETLTARNDWEDFLTFAYDIPMNLSDEFGRPVLRVEAELNERWLADVHNWHK